MIETLRQLADYGIAIFLIGGILGITFYWLRHMIPSWKDEKAADAELKRSIPHLAESLRQVAESQREITKAQEGILACTEQMRSEFENGRQRTDDKLDTLIGKERPQPG